MNALIKPEWFVGLHWAVLLVITAAAMWALMRGADLLVEGAAGMARRLGMPKVIVGATIVSLGTTSPEAAVSVMAAWQGNAGLALGNAVGSIIADTALIFGMGALMVRLPADRFVLTRQGWVQSGAATLLAGFCYFEYAAHGDAATIPRWIGYCFLLLLAGYMVISVRWARRHAFGEPFQAMTGNEDDDGQRAADTRAHDDDHHDAHGHPHHSVPALLVRIVVGLAVVIVTSHVLIQAVTELAHQIGVPQVVIAATLVALGTSLPELVVGFTSIRRGHPELLVGNVIGADILNVLFVIGASAAAKPLPILDPSATPPTIFLIVHLPAMLLVLALFRVFIHKAVKARLFDKWMGWPLVALYATYVVVQFALSIA
jgi:cation:H+ antiporter